MLSRFSTTRVRPPDSAAKIGGQRANANILAPGGQRDGCVRQIQRDARRVIDGEGERLRRRRRKA